MTTPTNVYNRNTGPVQRTQGCISGTYVAETDVSTTANAAIADGVLTITLGFVPKHFVLQNADATNVNKFEWFEGMTAGTYLVTQGTDGDCTLADDSGIVVHLRTGAGGVAGTRVAGTADTTPSGVIVVDFSATAATGVTGAVTQLVTDDDTVVWVAEG